jgi:hypothetical protein
VVSGVARHRRPREDAVDARFDVAVQGTIDESPGAWAAAGATWWLVQFDPFTVTARELRDAIARRPRPGEHS